MKKLFRILTITTLLLTTSCAGIDYYPMGSTNNQSTTPTFGTLITPKGMWFFNNMNGFGSIIGPNGQMYMYNSY